ncbi:MAG: DUF3488 and transglutaminase-like domain-containing protein [Gammaproteobacteria bacterium]
MISPSEHLVRLGWTSAALGISVAPHLPRMPAWIGLLTVACIGWRMLAAVRGWKAPWQWLRMLLAGGGFVAVIASYGTVNGLEAGSALLVVMMDMKLLETWRRRDYQVLMFISYFLVMAQLLYEPSMWTLPYMIVAVGLSTITLMQTVRRGPAIPAARASRLVGTMMLLALPLMLALFLLFPRVPGPFWAMPTRGGGISGLDDVMTPGSVNALSLSNAVAFRASFEGRVPPPIQRYWRGPVLHDFDGASWREPGGRPWRPIDIRRDGESIRYRVTMEPSSRPWLMTLDYPGDWSQPRAYLSADYQLMAMRPIEQLTAYSVVSYPDALTGLAIDPREQAMNLRLPAERNPRAQALAREIRGRHPDDRGFLRAVLERFTLEPYTYTLRPPALRGSHPVDEFLFDSRRGFCEHFASAFAVLMRAGGIPARIVTGYQGGELNPLNNRMTVRQSEAHAWTEVWLPDEGWMRVDPTAAVAPDRIELSLADALPESDLVPGRFMRSLPLLLDLQQRWDALDSAWNEWVLAYGPERQIALLRSLGVNSPDWRALAAVLGATVLLILGGVALWTAWHYRPSAEDRVQRMYRQFVARLARRGIHRAPWEGPLVLAERAQRLLPAYAGAIQSITRSYVRLRYEECSREVEMVRFRRLLKGFRP